jgi:hypothetical protein
MEALDHVSVAAPHADERARLVLAILELPLLVRAEGQTQIIGNAFAEGFGGVESEKFHGWLIIRYWTTN